jgi:hypothetical protein
MADFGVANVVEAAPASGTFMTRYVVYVRSAVVQYTFVESTAMLLGKSCPEASVIRQRPTVMSQLPAHAAHVGAPPLAAPPVGAAPPVAVPPVLVRVPPIAAEVPPAAFAPPASVEAPPVAVLAPPLAEEPPIEGVPAVPVLPPVESAPPIEDVSEPVVPPDAVALPGNAPPIAAVPPGAELLPLPPAKVPPALELVLVELVPPDSAAWDPASKFGSFQYLYGLEQPS